MFRTVARAMVLSFVWLSTPVFLTVGAAAELDYEFIAPTVGTISYNGLAGGTVQGTGIDVDLIVGLATPLNANVGRVCISCSASFVSGAFMSSTPSMWTFAAGGSITVVGGVDLDNNGVIGAGDIPLGTTLFTGTFDIPVTIVVLPGGFRVIGGGFTMTQSTALSTFYGVPTGAAVYTGGLNLSFASSIAPPNGFTSNQMFSGNMAVSAPESTPTPTNTSTNTPTNTPTNTSTSTPTDTPTNTPTDTGVPTHTPTNTPTNTATSTPSNTATRTPTATFTATNTPTNTATSTSTGTIVPSNTPTNTATNTATSTPSNTATPTPTATITVTNTPTNTATSTSTGTIVPSNTPTNTATPSTTATSSPPASASPTHTPTQTPTSTMTPTMTMTFTREIVEETPTPQVAIDLSIEKHFTDSSCDRGHPGQYQLIVHNSGEQSSPLPPAVTDTLPAGVTLVNATGTGWDCSASTTTVVSCTATSIFTPGESRTITLNINIALEADPALVNSATVAGQPGELDLTNNTSTVVTICVGGPTAAPVMGPMGFAIAIALLGAVAYWRLRGAFDDPS